uniref:Uncharacterized protein n=1 Tax=Ascaris lumbricoides TaxID=6252 RepID=A0A0M3II65_ASCLU
MKFVQLCTLCFVGWGGDRAMGGKRMMHFDGLSPK